MKEKRKVYRLQCLSAESLLFSFFKDFYLMWTIFKVFIEFFTSSALAFFFFGCEICDVGS